MEKDLSKVLLVGILMTFVMISFSFPSLAAEKKKFSMSTKMEKLISENYLASSGDFRNVLKQGVSLVIITEHTDPDFIGAEQTAYWLSDRPNRLKYTLIERGITVTRNKDGDRFYTRWESILKTSKPDNVNWELESESSFQFIGGNGKYVDIKGGGTCRGKRTPKEDTAKCEGEWEY
jgi:hypothetical protein